MGRCCQKQTCWGIYLFLNIWLLGNIVKGRIHIWSNCSSHRLYYMPSLLKVCAHTHPLRPHCEESPTACSLTNFRSSRYNSKSSILSIILKLENRVIPSYVGIGSIHVPINIKHIINTECMPQSHIKQQKICTYFFNLSLQEIILSQWSIYFSEKLVNKCGHHKKSCAEFYI